MKETGAGHPELILEMLRNLGLWLEREDKAHLLVAMPTLEEFRQQPLPSHLRTSVKLRKGPRVVIRGPRDEHTNRQILARWPKDNLIESSLPTLACVVHGAADLHIADYVVHCRTGDIMFRPPAIAAISGSEPHFEDGGRGRSCDLLWIFPGRLNGQGLECYICHSREDRHFLGPHLWFKNFFLSILFQELAEEISRPDGRESTSRLLSTLVFFLQRLILRGDATIPPFRSQMEDTRQLSRDPIQQALNYIDTHLGSHLTIELTARHVCISSSVFKKKFKQHTGQTFNQYVTRARMDKAAQMLRGTELFISEISELVGLADSQFRRLSLQYWGCTPREYRQRENEPI